MWRDDACLLDMFTAAGKVLAFTSDATWEKFQDDDVLQSAVMRQIQIIGEAARKVSKQTRDAHPEVPWTQIVGMRHRLVHEYFRIRLDRVWEVVQQDIPPFISMLKPLIPPEDNV